MNVSLPVTSPLPYRQGAFSCGSQVWALKRRLVPFPCGGAKREGRGISFGNCLIGLRLGWIGAVRRPGHRQWALPGQTAIPRVIDRQAVGAARLPAREVRDARPDGAARVDV